MPEIKNNFLKGKMNKDLDDRLIPKGEYREAQNIIISESEGSDVGAIENILGNKIPYSDTLTTSNTGNNTDIIGYVRDVKNNRIIFFITNFEGDATSQDIRTMAKADNLGSTITGSGSYSADTHYCGIYMYRGDQQDVKKLVTGAWLNFSKNHLITGVNILEDMLFWTDNYNQPRKINIDKAFNNYNSASDQYYLYEEQISVAKIAPWQPIRLTDCGQLFIGDGDDKTFTLTTDYFSTLPSAESEFDVYVNGYKIHASDYTYSSPTITFTGNSNTPNGSNHLEQDGAPKNAFEVLVKKVSVFSNEEHIESQYLKEKFVRFSYRYRYEDGEYSTLAPFTQPVFEPLNDAFLDYIQNVSNDLSISEVIKTTKLKLMENQINQVEMRIPLPELDETAGSNTAPSTWANTFNVTNIEIVAKESDSPAVKVIADVKVNATAGSTFMNSIESYHHKPINNFNFIVAGDHTGTTPAFTLATFDETDLEVGMKMYWEDTTLSTAYPSMTDVDYTFDTNTADSDPGAGKIKFNNGSAASVTVIYIDDDSATAGSKEAQYTILKNDTSNTIKGYIKVADNGDANTSTRYSVTNVEEATGYWKLTVTGATAGSSAHVTIGAATKDVTFYEVGDPQVKTITGWNATNRTVSYSGSVTIADGTVVTFIPLNHHRQVYKFLYRSEEPYKVIPEDQLIRVFDQVPLRAKAQEISGNRVIYGNYTENYPHPTDEQGNKGINFVAADGRKGNNEHADTAGYLQWLTKQYKYHSAKQRRTYQVGIVFADRFGRQSPVLLSTNQLQPTPVTLAEDQGVNDSYTIPNVSENFAREFDANGDGAGDTFSWSTLQEAFGVCLDIEFLDTAVTQGLSEVFNNTIGALYNPHGWYSYRVVVKQTEQDYYNVYCSHPSDSWNSIDNNRDTTRKGRSWLSLYGDNINKIPRDVKTQDETREGLSGSSARLFPKVISNGAQAPTGSYRSYSKMNDLGVQGTYGNRQRDLIDVISLGTAKDQGLWFTGDGQEHHPDYGSSGFNIAPFVYGRKKSPIVAELPNMSSMYNTHNPAGVKGVVQESTGTFASPAAPYGAGDTIMMWNLEDNSIGSGQGYGDDVDVIDGFYAGGTNIKPLAEDGKVKASTYDHGTKTITWNQYQSTKKGDEIYLSGAEEGLTIFETQPFESKLDIYWETSTCGLISELNSSIKDAAGAAPTNLGWDTTSPADGTSDTTTLTIEEGTAQGTNIGNLAATGALAPAGAISWEMISFKDNNNTEYNSKVYVQGSGAVQSASPGGGFYHSNSGYDNWTLRVRASESGGTSTTDNVTIAISNTRPICSHGVVTLDSYYEKPTDGSSFNLSFTSSSGAQDPAKFTDNLTVAHNFSNYTAANAWFDSTMSAGTTTLSTNSSWNSSTASTFFGLSASQRSVGFTITDLNGAGLASNNLCSTEIRGQQSRYSKAFRYHSTSCGDDSGCTDPGAESISGAACADTTTTYYVAQGTSASVDTSGGTLYNGNILYRNTSGAPVAPNGHFMYGDSASGNTTCYEVSSGSVIGSSSPHSCCE